MGRTGENQKAANLKATVLAAIILLIPSQLLAIQNDVPAAQTSVRTSSSGQPQISQRQIIVSLPDKQLALLEDGKVLKTYSIAVGAEVSRSPEGEFTIINRIEKPTYYAPGKVIGPGKENPLGTRWMGLSKKGYGIHGTNMPKSIGKAASHGCIRMRQHDLEELFAMVRIGDKVQLRNVQMTALLAPMTTPMQPVDAPALAANTNNAVSGNATPAVIDGTDQF